MSLLLQWLFLALSLVLPGCEGRNEGDSSMYWDAEVCGGGDGGQSFVSIELSDSFDLLLFEAGTYEVTE